MGYSVECPLCELIVRSGSSAEEESEDGARYDQRVKDGHAHRTSLHMIVVIVVVIGIGGIGL